MRRFLTRIGIGALLIILFYLTLARAQDVVDRIVAIVNGEVITLFELNQRFRPFLDQFEGRELLEDDKRMLLGNKQQLLERMIDEVLLRQEAQRLNINVTDVELQTQMRQFRERLGLTEAQFLEQLRIQGLDKELYEQRMREEIQRQRLMGIMVRRKVVVTTEEIEQYYAVQQKDFQQERRVHLGLILFDSPELAEEVHTRLRSGALLFDDAARTYSHGPGAQQGGDIGMPAWKDLAPEWREALAGLDVGEVSGIFFVQGRPAVLKFKGEEAGDVLPLNEVQDQIREKLMEPRLEARYTEYLEGLRSRALIDIRL
ncbi:MAG TPA: SurA domain-containing protein [Desulfonatronum sp.]|nr:SurA domain-containing protein [Desulfonatronum sp.]